MAPFLLPIFAAAAVSASSSPPAPTLTIRAIQDALNDLEVCRQPDPKQCWSPKRSYKVHGATCMVIPPEGGQPALACRVDSTITYEDQKYGWFREHDYCTWLGKRKPEAAPSGPSRPEWEVLQIRDRPCEIKSALKSDPNPLPSSGSIASAIKRSFDCYDPDGIVHCASGPDRVDVYNFRCKPIPAVEKDYPVRAVCRVNAAAFSRALSKTIPEHKMASFRDTCFRLDRYTELGKSPALWFIRYVTEEKKCELD